MESQRHCGCNLTARSRRADWSGAGVPHTDNLNIASIIKDKDDEVLRQTIEYLTADLPGGVEITEITEIKRDIVNMVACPSRGCWQHLYPGNASLKLLLKLLRIQPSA